MTEYAPINDRRHLPILRVPRLRACDGGRTQKTFRLESWSQIVFDTCEEWIIKRLLPKRGVAAIYGKPGSFKSFLALHMALIIAAGWAWAGKRVDKGHVVYIAAEGAAGLRKRKAGYVATQPDLPADLLFTLIASAPNLGAERGDVQALIAAIEAAGVTPAVIVIDTLAQTLGAGDENGAGMTAFIGNATALAEHFRALVLIVHHVGLGDDRRMRGHSSLLGALDAQILCERPEGEMSANLTLQKLKDEASDVRFTARLSRVVIGQDADGDDISTLVVESIEAVEAQGRTPRARSVPASQRLLMSVVTESIEEAGRMIRPFPDGPEVRAVPDVLVRNRYFGRIADGNDAAPDTQRRTFNRAIKALLDAKLLVAAEHSGERFVWLP